MLERHQNDPSLRRLAKPQEDAMSNATYIY